MADNTQAAGLVLASQSPIRARLLREAGLIFETAAAAVDEAGLIAQNAGRRPEDIASILAAAKAETVARTRPGALVIGADQLLVLGDEILQKPADLDAARQRIEALSGRSHRLVTAVCLVHAGNVVFSCAETAILNMHALKPAEIAGHMAEEGEAVLQSVGAYRLEGPGIRLFASLEGDYFAMLGLPLVPLLSALRRLAPHSLAGAAPA